MFLRNMLALAKENAASTLVPFSKLALEKERTVIINKKDLRLAYLTNPLIYRAINTRASLTVGRGFKLVFENNKVKECITNFLENARQNDPLGRDLQTILRQMCIDTDVFGSSLSMLVPNKGNNKFVAIKMLHPVFADFKRDAEQKIIIGEDGLPEAFALRNENTGEQVDLKRNEVNYLAFSLLGDELAGISLLTPIYNQIERLENIEEGLAQFIYKKGWPLHEAILKEKSNWTPTETDIAYIDQQINGIEASSTFTHTDDYELRIHDPKISGQVNFPTYFLDQIVAITGVPKYILMGQESVTTRATAESLQRTLGYVLEPNQQAIKAMIEDQLFRRVLDMQKIDGFCHIEWNEIMPEKDDRMAEKLNLLASTMVDGRPVITWIEARELLNLPAETTETPEQSSTSTLSFSPQTVGGIYLVQPHGQLIAQGRKKAIIKSVKLEKYVGQPLALVSGNFIWGKIQLDSPVQINNEKEFNTLFQKHYVTDEERKQWWNSTWPLFYYPLQIIEVYRYPRTYQVPKGVQTFIKDLRI